MRKFLALVLLYFMRFALWFRYRVTIKGLEHLNPKELNKLGGILFLPNHPTVFVDPTLVAVAIWRKYPIRPVIVEYMYYTPLIHTVMKLMNALPIPNFVTSSNSLKKKKADGVIETIMDELKKKENFLIYPAGKTKHQAREVVGASGVHRIIQSVPEANVVLVRTTGLWGSRFSRALTGGATPDMFGIIFWGIKAVLKNLLFFTPRRDVTIEFTPAGPDFPYQASRLEMNRYLEKWYNRPDGILPQQGEEPGESLYLVSYSMWREELPQIPSALRMEANIDLAKIPPKIQEKVKQKLSEMTQMSVDKIQPEMDLAGDLGLDSLDNAEIISFLDDQYDVSGVPVNELTSVGKVMAIAATQISFGEPKEEEKQDLSHWDNPRPEGQVSLPTGQTIHEVFLNTCQLMGKAAACGDATAGVLTYATAKLRVLLLAEYIRHLPGKYIGILLPSSVAAYLTVLACQLAGKIPLMINWTVGPRHLESVAALSQVQVILSSWSFLDRLENVDLNGIEDLIVMLEDVRRKLTLKDKITAYYRSKLGTKALLSLFQVEEMTEEDEAVLLFTSGTESMPKGVPLSHRNILANQRGAIQEVGLLESGDVLLGMLPPFHSFGFTVSGLLPLLTGIRVAYYPDPTDGKGIGRAIQKWKATLICGAPSFLKGIFKNASSKQIQTLRLALTGAEKAPDDLFQMVNQLGHCRLLEGYGITECAPILTVNLTGDPMKGVGKPLPEVDICVTTLDSHQPIPQGQQGLILAKGPNVFNGYLNKGIAAPFATVNGQQWYITGDLGYLDPEGSLIISGRLKRFVKIGGEMISLAAIEDALLKTIGRKADLQEEGPVIAVCAKEEAGEKSKIVVFTRLSTTVEEVNRSLKEAGFSNLVKVYKVQQLDEIPLMGTGKVNYRVLEAQLPALLKQQEYCNTH